MQGLSHECFALPLDPGSQTCGPPQFLKQWRTKNGIKMSKRWQKNSNSSPKNGRNRFCVLCTEQKLFTQYFPDYSNIWQIFLNYTWVDLYASIYGSLPLSNLPNLPVAQILNFTIVTKLALTPPVFNIFQNTCQNSLAYSVLNVQILL